LDETQPSADEKIVKEAQTRFKRAQDWESTARTRYRQDIKFCEGDSDNLYQWDTTIYNGRVGRDAPALTINKTRQHCLQIVNDARQNKAQIRIRPVGDGATYEAAKVFEGVCRHIEYISNAMEAYDAATWHQVAGGWGYWRIVTDYIDSETFDQEIYIKRIHDPLTVYLDCDIQEFDGSDARWGFVFQDVPKEQFDADYPKWKDELAANSFGQTDDWHDKEHVRIAEYYRKTDKTDKILLLAMPSPDGGEPVQTVVRESDMPPEIRRSIPKEMILKERDAPRAEIEWFKIVGDRIVERRVGKDAWPGSYIPIVRIIGEETVIDGQMDRKGHTRALKDPQRMYNYWSSAAVEFGALQTKTPYIAPAAAIEGLETYWSEANRVNRSVLPYNHMTDDGQPIPAPSRIQPPVSAPVALDAMKTAQMEMMMASGQYQSQFGENENAKSGVAIQTRQRQGDNATYHYIDHLAQGIRFTGRILIDLIPKIYDTPRVIKILAENGDESEVHVQPGMEAGVPHQQMVGDQPASAEEVKTAQADPDMADKVKTIFDPSVGKYEVEADIGPAFATKRQEAFAAISQMMSQNQELVKIAGDILFRAADFPYADEMAERFKRTIPPNILGEGPPPALAQMQQQAQQHVEAMQKVIASLIQENADKDRKLSDRDDSHTLDSYKAETARLAAIGSVDPEVLKPIFRAWMSEMIGMPVEPQMIAHSAVDEAISTPFAPPAPMGAPDPQQQPDMAAAQ
jgi:hypothetical protein